MLDINKGKVGPTKTYYDKEKHCFTVDALNKQDKTVFEFQGCYFHGCRTCKPGNVVKHDKTVERIQLLEAAGYKVVQMWECQWKAMKKTLPNWKEIEREAKEQHITIRDSLFGGRTEAFKTYLKCEKNQKIYYFDVVSLYPTVNALDVYPVGFKKYVKTTVEDIRSGKFFGLVKVDITPPKNLYVPVLPDNSNGKLLFHLNPMKQKTWTSIELKKALEKGYTIDKIHAALEYKKVTGLMKKYVEHFLKLKIENTKTLTQEKCDKLNESHKRMGFNFVIEPHNTCENPGMKQLAKICLNSLWGKFGQRTALSNYEFIYDYNKLLTKLNDDTKKDKSWHIINEKCVELKCTDKTEYAIEADYISEITAVFTTASARLRLYDMLAWLDPSQLIYCDTDSVIFMVDEDNAKHKKPSNEQENMPATVQFGDALGDWEDECKGKYHITEIVCGGAKSYAYVTSKGEVVIKQKGITLDRANASKINFDTMTDMVLKQQNIQSEERFTFRWEDTTKDIITKYQSRSIQATASSKRQLLQHDTRPFGFSLDAINI